MNRPRISKSWLRMSEIYRRFARNHLGGEDPSFDFSDSAALACFLFESRGIGDLKQGLFPDPSTGMWNGFAVGKKWMDVTVKMWREDLKCGLLARDELETEYPEWFLAAMLPR